MEARCPICQEIYSSDFRIPRILPECGHTFCQSCTKENGVDFFVCPLDNQTHCFKSGKNEMPVNMTLLRYIKNKRVDQNLLDQSLKARPVQEQYKIMINPASQLSNETFRKQLQILDQMVANSPKALELGLQDINQFLTSKVKNKFKNYYKYLQEQELILIQQMSSLKIQFKSLFSINQNQINQNIRQVKEIVNSKSYIKVQDMKEKVRESMDCIKNKFNKIKQNINRKFHEVQFLNISPISKIQINQFSQNLTLANNNELQIKIPQLTKLPQNYGLSIISKSPSQKSIVSRGSSRDPISSFKLFINKRTPLQSPAKNPSQITVNSRFSPNLKKPLKLQCSDFKEGTERSHNQYFDLGSLSSTPRKRPLNASNRSFSSEKDKLQDRRRLDDILLIIQQNPSPNLELINMGIKDTYMRQIGSFINHNKSKKIGLLKLVKNQISDRGLSHLLAELYDYPYMHTLNLTSNHLTDASFDTILEFSKHNKMLSNFYVSNNSMMVPKGYRKLLNDLGVNIFL